MRLLIAAASVLAFVGTALAENRLIRTECKDGVCRRVYVGSSMEYEIVDRVNSVRRGRGLQPLRVTVKLMESARSWSGTQARQHRMYHSSGLGVGENVAFGQRDAEDVMRAWIASPGHYRNITNSKYREIGVGVVRASNGRLYYTQHFR
jgi:uncharacterized protein YkwD